MPKPGTKAWRDRVAMLAAEEAATPKRLFYLSYASETEFLGAIIIETRGMTTAMMETHALGINPGGECMGIEIPPENYPPKECWNRLLSREEVERYMGPGQYIGEYEEEAK